ncbi:MAG: alcohol dehydrogenase catalytic domain-containing protein, partial [Actinobacteria bacterium]|nr:alcohol dehydrogenase catalytic domain-containing protein [Actinomycetota bacterium]
MRAALWYKAKDMRVEEIPTPELTPGMALVRVDRTGICGTDLEEYLLGPVIIPQGMSPIILGHEFVATIVEDTTGTFAPGTMVIPDGVIGCGTCYQCLRHEEGRCAELNNVGLQTNGGLAEYMVTNPLRCVPVPKGVSPDVAVFTEPTAVAVRAANKIPNIPGSTIAVLGGGTIGILCAQVARAFGALRVVVYEPNKVRQEVARGLGFEVLDPLNPSEMSLYKDFDSVMECSGVKDSTKTSLAILRSGGTAVLVGFRPGQESFDLLDFILTEKRIVGTAAHMWDVDISAAVG